MNMNLEDYVPNQVEGTGIIGRSNEEEQGYVSFSVEQSDSEEVQSRISRMLKDVDEILVFDIKWSSPEKTSNFSNLRMIIKDGSEREIESIPLNWMQPLLMCRFSDVIASEIANNATKQMMKDGLEMLGASLPAEDIGLDDFLDSLTT